VTLFKKVKLVFKLITYAYSSFQGAISGKCRNFLRTKTRKKQVKLGECTLLPGPKATKFARKVSHKSQKIAANLVKNYKAFLANAIRNLGNNY
jgi:hypothetical protein